ncbi:MAG TPA: Rossmann-like and DUF2520 domain-containing protein [Terriglobales bacterium]|nr:Rossmann-like and DUF2520 domain-containing protein [Terriglobales bacterium]
MERGNWIVVGSGRVGAALCRWLADAGLTPLAVVGRRRPLALARRCGIANAWTTEDWQARLPGLAPASVLLAIPDDALAPLAARLAPARSPWRGWTVLHTSGARDAGVLAPLARRGAAVGSLHPMMTFPRAARPAPSPANLIFSFEGSPAARRQAAALVLRWRGVPLQLPPRAKTAYHLAATLVGPGAVVQMAAARHILRRAGLRGRQLERALAGLRSLLTVTASNLADGLEAAWTGPLARGDRATLALHRRALRSPQLARLYAALMAAGRELLPSQLSKKATPTSKT